MSPHHGPSLGKHSSFHLPPPQKPVDTFLSTTCCSFPPLRAAQSLAGGHGSFPLPSLCAHPCTSALHTLKWLRLLYINVTAGVTFPQLKSGMGETDQLKRTQLGKISALPQAQALHGGSQGAKRAPLYSAPMVPEPDTMLRKRS